jgi:hypothetical protein
MKHEIDRDRFVTISELTKLLDLGVTDNAVRRNINKYPEYFASQFIRGVQYLEKENAMKVYRVIHGALRPGRNRGGHDVRDALIKVGIEPIPKAEPEHDVSPIHQASPDKQLTVRLSDEDRALIKELIKKGG